MDFLSRQFWVLSNSSWCCSENLIIQGVGRARGLLVVVVDMVESWHGHVRYKTNWNGQTR